MGTNRIGMLSSLESKLDHREFPFLRHAINPLGTHFLATTNR